MAKAKIQKSEGGIDVSKMSDAEFKETLDRVSPETNGHQPAYRVLRRDQLIPSPTNPRKRFPEASITELAESIKEQGILEPLIVRPRMFVFTGHDAEIEHGDFEIVCGERRWRSAGIADLYEIPTIIRELTDEQVLDIQIHENLHREDVHPMDEAYGYKFLQETLACDVAELAVRVGKPEAYVLNRLKLNQLIPEVQKDVEDGFLPIGHALEIAKFAPDSQLAILNEGAYDTEQKHEKGQWIRVPVKTKPTLLNEFREWIAEKILWRLAKAPFDRKAANLRTDGLACVNCPNRTGANAVLFDKGTGNNDSCLDPICWKGKAQTHVKITREKLAHEACVEVDKIPLVNTGTWSDRGDILGYNSFIQIKKGKIDAYDQNKSNKECSSSITTIDVGEKNYGKLVTICLPSSKCKVHYKASKSASSSSSSGSTKTDTKADEAALIAKRERKEEIFDMRVAELVRWRVFRLAADIFAKNVTIDGEGKGFLPRLVAKIWVNSNNGEASHTRGIVNSTMSQIMDLPQGHFGLQNYDLDRAEQDAKKLSDTNLKLALFFLVHGEKGHTYFDRMTSQKAVRELAEEYGLHFELMDAQARVEVAGEKAKKHLDLYKKYLAEVETGKKDAKIPRPWAESYSEKK